MLELAMAKCPSGCECGRHTAKQPKCPEGCTCGRHISFGSERRQNISKALRQTPKSIAKRARFDALEPPLCACGCGEFATVDERRSRVSKFRPGHNSKCDHPMKGKRHSEEAKAKLASYNGEKGSSFKHGKSDTLAFRSWTAMRSRCRDEGNGSYQYYGGRGITVCERWESFENFLADMGQRPSRDYVIDREDPDGNYEPGNCRWITKAENQARKRNGWPTRRANQAAREAEASRAR